MRRISTSAAVLSIVLLVLVTAGRIPSTGAQDASPTALAEHPLVGTWIVGGPDQTPAIATFGADGIVVDVEIDTTFAGIWEATGERTAAATFAGFYVDGEFGASVVIRVTIEIDETGDAFTADYSYTAVHADGTALDSGRGTATGVRMVVEPVDAEGTPLGGLGPWTLDGDGGDATPEASPEA